MSLTGDAFEIASTLAKLEAGKRVTLTSATAHLSVSSQSPKTRTSFSVSTLEPVRPSGSSSQAQPLDHSTALTAMLGGGVL